MRSTPRKRQLPLTRHLDCTKRFISLPGVWTGQLARSPGLRARGFACRRVRRLQTPAPAFGVAHIALRLHPVDREVVGNDPAVTQQYWYPEKISRLLLGKQRPGC